MEPAHGPRIGPTGRDDLEGQGQGHPRSNIDIIRKWIGDAWGVLLDMSDNLEGQGQGHSRSNIDYIRKMTGDASGVFPYVSRDFRSLDRSRPSQNGINIRKKFGTRVESGGNVDGNRPATATPTPHTDV